MTALPAVHLVVMQPQGYVHSLGFLDQARYLRHQFRRFGAQVTLGKNRLREDAVNFVFGAHLGFPAEWKQRHACVFFNLEQLGEGGAQVSAEYLHLLRHSAVADYDPANVSSYAVDAADVPIVPFLHAPYLEDAQASPLESRPIDLLFFGSMNPRRQAYLQRIENCGVKVTGLAHALYGPERDRLVRQAKAVINCHFYESSRFEQARAFHCLSLGTPVISERGPSTQVPEAFEDAVFWLPEGGLAGFFGRRFMQPAFYQEARERLAGWANPAHDPMEAYADLLAFAAGFHRGHRGTLAAAPWQPRRINLGSGKDYKPGWLNLDILDRAEPDLVLDLGRPLELPLTRATRFGGEVTLEAGGIDTLYANNVLEHVPDLPMLMGNALALLKTGGEFEIEVPYEKAPTAWQDPTHLRALNENSWLYYTDWFWYLGWFEHRFEITQSSWLDMQLKPCAQSGAAFMRVRLRKVETTVQERMTARTLQADFGGIDSDLGAHDIDQPAQLPSALEPAAVATS
jgi:hypothetical protein